VNQRTLLFALALAVMTPGSARADCPVGTKLSVDNDIAGSGYSESPAENFASDDTYACNKTYRYLTKYSGDGTSKGKATWKPAILAPGWYRVVTSYRQTTNRTDNADYYIYDDKGQTTHKVINQRDQGSGCTKEDLGLYWCNAGGSCRLVLDGNDGESAAADITTFTLESCDAEIDAGANPCLGISENPSFEVCETTATTCAGVFNGAEGCAAYCAAAGMVCTARFGAGSGCSKETNYPITPCDVSNGHGSDWCECAFAPGQDAGQGGSGGEAGATQDASIEDASASDDPDTATDTGGAAGDGALGPPPGTGGSAGAPGGHGVDVVPASGGDSGCSCGVARGGWGGWLMLISLAAVLSRRRSRGR
jgi:hypothetical protein